MRKKIVAGNWKMNMNLNEGLELARGLNNHFISKLKPTLTVELIIP